MNLRRPQQGRLQTALIATAVSAVAAAALLALGLYLVPRVLPNLETRVVDGDTVEELRGGGADARITVPAGWVVQRGWGDQHELIVRSPDGKLSVTMTVVDEQMAAAFDAGARTLVRGEDLGPPVTERLASGLEVIHAGSAEAGVLVAAVGGPAASSVGVVARGPADRLPAYRAALASLLDGVRVGA